MLRINLLPVRQIKKRAAARNQLIAGSIAFFILLLFLALTGTIQSSIANGIRSDIAGLNRIKQNNAPILAEIKRFEQKKAELERRISVIEKLKKNSSLTVRVMDEVANLIDNDRMWLLSLKQTGASLSMKGVALDNRTIAVFMDALKDSPWVNRESVELGDASLKKVADKNLKAFSLRCSVAPPQEKSSQEKSGGKV